MPVAHPAVHRPGCRVPVRSCRTSARSRRGGGRALVRRARGTLHAPRRAVLLRGPRGGIRHPRSRGAPARTHRPRRRRRRGPRRDAGVAWAARDRGGLPPPGTGGPPSARALGAGLRRALRLVQAGGRRGPRLSADARRILTVQALRAFAYGFGSVVLGISLERRGLSTVAVGLVLAALLAGAALASFAVARFGDAVGRGRTYGALLALMGLAGAVFALTDSMPALVVAALTGTISTEIVESGPFTSLEQSMLPSAAGGGGPTQMFREVQR